MDQRYYASAYGRFATIDPLKTSADPKTPQSWNRYAYVDGDPINNNDPRGQNIFVGCDSANDDNCPGGFGTWGPSPCDVVYQELGFGLSCASPTVPVTLPTQPAQPPPPSCSISVYERPVQVPGISLIADHTYLLVQDSSGASETLEGGPDFGGGFLPIGYLVGYVSNPPGNGLPGTNPYSSTNSQVGISSYTGPLACGKVQTIERNESNYNTSGAWVPYDFGTFFGGYNSNSFTYTLLNNVGLSNFFGSPNSTPGWGLLVPGL